MGCHAWGGGDREVILGPHISSMLCTGERLPGGLPVRRVRVGPQTMLGMNQPLPGAVRREDVTSFAGYRPLLGPTVPKSGRCHEGVLNLFWSG